MIRRVRIGYLDYSLVFNEGMAEAGDFKGQIDYDKGTIIIRPSLNQQQQAQTLFHEIIHGVISNSRLSKVIRHDWQEAFVDVLASGIVQVIRDNPALVAWVGGLWKDPCDDA